MRAEIISLGSELITGAAVDTNSAWLSARLTTLGVIVRRHLTIGDEQAAITAALASAVAGAELVIVTGGLGPTADDLTREALADLVSAPLVLHEPSAAAIEAFFAAIGRSMPASNRRQAMLPEGAEPLENRWGTAPGIRLVAGNAMVFALPGVPREAQAMFAAYVEPFVVRHSARRAIVVRTLHTYGAGESTVAEQLADLMAPGRNPAVGTTASEGVITVRIVARGSDAAQTVALAERDAQTVRGRLGSLVYGEDEDALAHVVGRLLAERGLTLTTAESCTGGLIGKYITDVAGSSAYYLGGFVTYADAQKVALLAVPPALLERCGAVSAEVAAAMAEGGRAALGSDYALSATGIAGPAGGTAEKKVGLVYLGLAGADGATTRRCQFHEALGREAIRDRAAKTALNLLRLALLRAG